MFTQNKLLFFYAITPVHMGAGQAVGVVDNPIQRERHTNHPVMAGSGIKGAVRHHASAMGWDRSLVKRLFGPENTDSLYAGAVSFGDAQIVVFPVRSLKQGFVYAASPTSLARLERLAGHFDIDTPWDIPGVQDEEACICDNRVASGGKQLVLETYQFTASVSDQLKEVASWLATHVLPDNIGNQYFKDKLKTDLVLLPDQAFSHFVEYATLVEPHVRINEETGAADSGGLFYTENLPPESLLVAPVFSSDERYQKDHKPDSLMSAREVIAKLQNGLHSRLLQIGGDATIGRGQMLLHFAEGET